MPSTTKITNSSWTELPVGHCAGRLDVATAGPGFSDISLPVADWLAAIDAGDGTVHVFVRHTSASLTIQENADPDVLLDLADALSKFAPWDRKYRHHSEGRDDMPAHIRAMLTSSSLTIPVRAGHLALGVWQGLYLIEHRARPHQRSLALDFFGSRK